MEKLMVFNAKFIEEKEEKKKEKGLMVFNAGWTKSILNLPKDRMRVFEASKIPEPTDYLDKWYYVARVARQRIDDGEPVPLIVKDLQKVDTRGFVLMIINTSENKYKRISHETYNQIKEIVCDLTYIFDYLHLKSVKLPISNEEYSMFLAETQAMFMFSTIKRKRFYDNKDHFVTNKEGLVTEHFKNKPSVKYDKGSIIHLQIDALSHINIPGKIFKLFKQIKHISYDYIIYADLSSDPTLSFEENLNNGDLMDFYSRSYKKLSVSEFFNEYKKDYDFFYRLSTSQAIPDCIMETKITNLVIKMDVGTKIRMSYQDFYDQLLSGLF